MKTMRATITVYRNREGDIYISNSQDLLKDFMATCISFR